MKKLYFGLFGFMLLFLTACGGGETGTADTETESASAEGEATIYTTVFALKSLTEQITGDFAQVESIYPNGTDIHTFEPTQQDMIKFAESDLFVTTNSELDTVSQSILDTISDQTESLEAIQNTDQLLEFAHDHSHGEGEGHDHSHDHGSMDPHIWLDPVIASEMVDNIEAKLSEMYPDNAENFQSNADALKEDLADLDSSLQDATADTPVENVYISHESIGYLSDRYGFQQVGVSGINNEEPSQQELIDILEGVKSDGAKYLLLEQNISSNLTDTIQNEADIEPLQFHNLAVLIDEDNTDATYQSLMEGNIEVLDQALNDYNETEAEKMVENAEAHDHSHDHGHDHSHDGHGHAHIDEDVYNGYFEDAQVEDRELSDWSGDWQSVYPYLEDGTLDEVFEHKAEEGDMTAEEYKEYYTTGYQTDVERIEITDSEMTFHQNGESHTGTYVSDGYEILEYEAGNRGVRYIFKLENPEEADEALPRVIQFSDHAISPMDSYHFHIYMGDDNAALLEEMDHWPTYYPSDLSGEEIAEEMMAH
ncbi:ZinT/AdcA family metal-binding protein [Salinicoccus cyprini]|uniref:ZinT/AdcA family metal-binding protein n=1 Tax=Salinicoccus cyprini TaxID=2493691 RepID=A0A558AXL6_9STAP|nr:ZinT/AdcA family metal-binding protein [Salinicoccus cyprini]TVT29007.1 ZinT/AdcA family metal-binding protein [Salinicoccus cyprini]